MRRAAPLRAPPRHTRAVHGRLQQRLVVLVKQAQRDVGGVVGHHCKVDAGGVRGPQRGAQRVGQPCSRGVGGPSAIGGGRYGCVLPPNLLTVLCPGFALAAGASREALAKFKKTGVPSWRPLKQPSAAPAPPRASTLRVMRTFILAAPPGTTLYSAGAAAIAGTAAAAGAALLLSSVTSEAACGRATGRAGSLGRRLGACKQRQAQQRCPHCCRVKNSPALAGGRHQRLG